MSRLEEEKAELYRNANILLEIGTGFIVTILGMAALGIVAAIGVGVVRYFF